MLSAIITVEGSPAEVVEVLRCLGAQAGARLSPIADPLLAALDWEAHPALARLRPKERKIVLLDLACEPRRRIAALLELTASTVTVYRRTIRLKLRAAPPEQYPVPLREWLRRFPGQASGTLAPPSTPP